MSTKMNAFASRRLGLGLCVVGLLLTAGVATPAFAQATAPAQAQPAENLPEAKALHAKYIEAIGGEAALKGLKSRVTTSKLNIPSQNMSAKITSYQADGKIYVVTEIPQFGNMESGYTDSIAWSKMAMTGPQILEGAERDQLLREADLQSDLDLTKYYTKLETVGSEDVDGKKAYKVEFTPITGEKQTRFFDAESGLLVKIEMTQETAQGKIPMTATLTDYRDVNGIKMPYKTVQKAQGVEIELVVESAAHNTDVAGDKFTLPADIKALAEKKKAAKEGTKPEGVK
jgi:zinc protease